MGFQGMNVSLQAIFLAALPFENTLAAPIFNLLSLFGEKK
jgi:hypothetical protein